MHIPVPYEVQDLVEPCSCYDGCPGCGGHGHTPVTALAAWGYYFRSRWTRARLALRDRFATLRCRECGEAERRRGTPVGDHRACIEASLPF